MYREKGEGASISSSSAKYVQDLSEAQWQRTQILYHHYHEELFSFQMNKENAKKLESPHNTRTWDMSDSSLLYELNLIKSHWPFIALYLSPLRKKNLTGLQMLIAGSFLGNP